MRTTTCAPAARVAVKAMPAKAARRVFFMVVLLDLREGNSSSALLRRLTGGRCCGAKYRFRCKCSLTVSATFSPPCHRAATRTTCDDRSSTFVGTPLPCLCISFRMCYLRGSESLRMLMSCNLREKSFKMNNLRALEAVLRPDSRLSAAEEETLILR